MKNTKLFILWTFFFLVLLCLISFVVFTIAKASKDLLYGNLDTAFGVFTMITSIVGPPIIFIAILVRIGEEIEKVRKK